MNNLFSLTYDLGRHDSRFHQSSGSSDGFGPKWRPVQYFFPPWETLLPVFNFAKTRQRSANKWTNSVCVIITVHGCRVGGGRGEFCWFDEGIRSRHRHVIVCRRLCALKSASSVSSFICWSLPRFGKIKNRK